MFIIDVWFPPLSLYVPLCLVPGGGCNRCGPAISRRLTGPDQGFFLAPESHCFLSSVPMSFKSALRIPSLTSGPCKAGLNGAPFFQLLDQL